MVSESHQHKYPNSMGNSMTLIILIIPAFEGHGGMGYNYLIFRDLFAVSQATTKFRIERGR
jgi:hypothetical protein